VHVNAKRAAWIVLGAVVVVAIVALIADSRPSNSPRARADRLAHQLACPECSGESVADSNSVSARAIREDIPHRIAQGQSDAQIRAAYVAQYGDKVVLTPSGSGIGVVAWVLPVGALLLGLFGIAFALRRWSRTPRLHASERDEEIVAHAREAEA
jgi:cytochrome c-type biogenesis protein CcmH